jgi:hypothetical protein
MEMFWTSLHLYNSAKLHSVMATQQLLQCLRWKILEYLTYSPDLTFEVIGFNMMIT